MAILRHHPGEPAPFAGTYALVGHYGEATDVAVWCEKGSRLPLVAVTGYGELWYVLVATSDENAQVA